MGVGLSGLKGHCSRRSLKSVRAGHFLEEAFVKFVRHVVAVLAELLVEGGDRDQAGGIASRGDGDLYDGDLVAENFLGGAVDPVAVNFVEVAEGLELDDEVEAFFEADRREAEEVGGVDDANATHFEVATCEFGAGGTELGAEVFDMNEVVGDEGSAAFEEADGGFAFP